MLVGLYRLATNQLTHRTSSFKQVLKMSFSSVGSKFKVYVTQPIPQPALDLLQNGGLDVVVNEKTPLDRETFMKSIHGVDAIFCTLNEKINNELLDRAGDKIKVRFFDGALKNPV
jgi:hypothetical protein